MYPQERTRIDEAFAYLSKLISELAHWKNPPPDANPPSGRHLDAIISLLERWPKESLFPGLYLTSPHVTFVSADGTCSA